MSVNSKNKGSKAERELAKVWERWTGYKFPELPCQEVGLNLSNLLGI